MNIHTKIHKKYFSTFFPFHTFILSFAKRTKKAAMWKKKFYYDVCLLLCSTAYIHVYYVRIRGELRINGDPEITFPIKILIKRAVCAETSC